MTKLKFFYISNGNGNICVKDWWLTNTKFGQKCLLLEVQPFEMIFFGHPVRRVHECIALLYVLATSSFSEINKMLLFLQLRSLGSLNPLFSSTRHSLVIRCQTVCLFTKGTSLSTYFILSLFFGGLSIALLTPWKIVIQSVIALLNVCSSQKYLRTLVLPSNILERIL